MGLVVNFYIVSQFNKRKIFNVSYSEDKPVIELINEDIGKVFGYYYQAKKRQSCRLVSYDNFNQSALVKTCVVVNGEWTLDLDNDKLPDRYVKYSDLCYATVTVS